MQRIFTLIACCFFIAGAFAQNTSPYWQWGKADTSVQINIAPGYPHNVIAAANKKIFWGVLQNSKIALNPASYGDYRVREHDSMGNPIGTGNMFHGKMYFRDAKADASGNWYILGTYYDTVQYINSFITVKTQFNSPDQFILRLNAGTLDMPWFTHLGVNYYSTSNCFVIKGNYIYMPIDSALITTVYKINTADGSRTALLSQKAGRVTSIAVDSNDNIYIAGNCAQWGDSADFNGHKIYMNTPYQAYVVRYHSSYQYDWSVWMNDITCTNRQLTFANNNNICYAGGLNDSLTIGSYFVKKPRIIGSNFIAVSFDSTGAARWVRTAVDSAGTTSMDYICNSVFVDTTFVVMPTAQNYINWGNGITSNFSTRTLPVLIGYDKTGNTSWMKFTDTKVSVAHHIITDGKDIWITGNFRDSFFMALDTVTVIPGPVVTWGTPYMAKLKMPAVESHDTGSYVGNVRIADYTIAPNPATSVVRIAGLTEPTDVKLVSITGTMIYELKAAQPKDKLYIDVSTYPRGLYFVELKTATGRTVKKIVLN
jgi:hypothetical protein